MGRTQNGAAADIPDPLIVYPPSQALVELEMYLDDPLARQESGFLVPIAPDALHKANVSGAMWYNISVPAEADGRASLS